MYRRNRNERAAAYIRIVESRASSTEALIIQKFRGIGRIQSQLNCIRLSF